MAFEKLTFHILKYSIVNWGEQRRLLPDIGRNSVAFTPMISCGVWTESRVCWGIQTGRETK